MSPTCRTHDAEPADGGDDAGWLWAYDGWQPGEEPARESLTALGNGYMATRGALPGSRADGVHYPGTYVAGCYDRAVTALDGRHLESESMVNLPDWLDIALFGDDGERLDPDHAHVVDYRLRVDLSLGLLHRVMRLADGRGRRTSITERRLVHMGQPHLAAVELTVTPQNWSGRLVVRARINTDVANTNVVADRGFNPQHLSTPLVLVVDNETAGVTMTTLQSQVRVAEATRTRISRNATALALEGPASPGTQPVADQTVMAKPGDRVVVERVAAVYTSRDAAISEPLEAAVEEVGKAGGFDELLATHAAAWSRLWGRLPVATGDRRVDNVLRLHAFHLLQTLSPHTAELDVGVPARGLHGEGYQGHVFWDDVLVLPFLTYRLPGLVRSLLDYRYRRLDRAREAAADAGFAGAMFPWQSGSDGREETPGVLFNPRSGRWVQDRSRLQRHVNAAVAYNVWHYYQVTGDIEFLATRGAELLVEIARLFASLATYNPDRGRFEIRGVVGPDEFHDAYPGAVRPGIDNNAYTNVMAVWVLRRAADALGALHGYHCDELSGALDITDEELAHWSYIASRMYVPIHADGIISQFDGFEHLAELDWNSYRARYANIGRLDLILEAEGDTANRYQAAKQADVLMLLYLLSAEELRDLLDGLGYPFTADQVRRTVDYYLARTTHGSTLSRTVDAWILARADRRRSWGYFAEALQADVADTQGGTTGEGIHLGAMAGTLDVLQRCYSGLEVREDLLRLNPLLPDELPTLRLHLLYRGHWLETEITHSEVAVTSAACRAKPVQIDICGTPVEVTAGTVHRRRLPQRHGRHHPAPLPTGSSMP